MRFVKGLSNRLVAALVLSAFLTTPVLRANDACDLVETKAAAKDKEFLELTRLATSTHRTLSRVAGWIRGLIWFRGAEKPRYFEKLKAKSHQLEEFLRGENESAARQLIIQSSVEVEFAFRMLRFIRGEITKRGWAPESAEYKDALRQMQEHEKNLGWYIHDYNRFREVLATLKVDPKFKDIVKSLESVISKELIERMPAELRERIADLGKPAKLSDVWKTYNEVMPGLDFPDAAYWRQRRILSVELRGTVVGTILRIASANGGAVVGRLMTKWIPKTFLNRVPLIDKVARRMVDSMAFEEHYGPLNDLLLRQNRPDVPEMYAKLKDLSLQFGDPIIVTFFRRADTAASRDPFVAHIEKLVAEGKETKAFLDMVKGSRKSADFYGALSATRAPYSPQDVLVFASLVGLEAYTGVVRTGLGELAGQASSLFRLTDGPGGGPTDPNVVTIDEIRIVLDMIEGGMVALREAKDNGDREATADYDQLTAWQVKFSRDTLPQQN